MQIGQVGEKNKVTFKCCALSTGANKTKHRTSTLFTLSLFIRYPQK